MGDANYPTITDAQLKEASRARERQFFVAVFLAGGTATAYHALEAPGGRIGRFVQKGYSGIDIHPVKGGMPTVSIGKSFFITGLLPSPVGYVPAEYYGLHPDFVQNAAGFHVGKHLPFVSADQSRIREFEVKQRAEAIVNYAAPGGSDYIKFGPNQSRYAPGPVKITKYELDYLRSLPAGLSPRVTDFLTEIDAGRLTVPAPDPEPLFNRDELTGHLVHLGQPSGKTVEAIEVSPGHYVKIDAQGRPRFG